MSKLLTLRSQADSLKIKIDSNKEQFDSKLEGLLSLESLGGDTKQLKVDLENLKQDQTDLNNNLSDTNRSISDTEQSANPTATVKSPEGTNPSQTEQATAEKYTKSESVGAAISDKEQQIKNTSGIPVLDETGTAYQGFFKNPETGELYSREEKLASQNVHFGGQKQTTPLAQVRMFTPSGKQLGNDLRARIVVPDEYLRSNTPGIALLKNNFNGIIFPYTPTINFEHQATYTPQQPLHSNFAFNFYQRSQVTSIQISGKFTVQNKKDAEVFIGTTKLLAALTKMKFGDDRDAGAPPPVCRLHAYGTYMLRNVPISISSFRFDIPDTVDYYVYDAQDSDNVTSIPVMTTLNITCVLMYSRREMQQFNVDNYLNSHAKIKKVGYL
jgi:hypothetical protein